MNKAYCDLLKQQVNAEIDFLVSIGHDTMNPDSPCVFCYEIKNKNHCDRLFQLKNFLTDINIYLSRGEINNTP